MVKDRDDIETPRRSRSGAPDFSAVVDARYSRRDVLRAVAVLGTAAVAASAYAGPFRLGKDKETSALSSLTFKELDKQYTETATVARGYNLSVLLRWGDRLHDDAPEFDPAKQSAKTQAQQFGYNNDFIAYLPFPYKTQNSARGLLCVNHEYTITRMMFSGVTSATKLEEITEEQVEVEQQSLGISIVKVENRHGDWQYVRNSPYNRRITATTPIKISGPAAGHNRLKTRADKTGRLVIGTFANCAGGVTPWHTAISAEENFDDFFIGDISKSPEKRNHERYGVGAPPHYYAWHRFDPRFDPSKEPNEANRFGWIVEYDPYDIHSVPVKRTALGRFKHECAVSALAPDGRVVAYMADDEAFEYLYRFVSQKPFDAKNRAANMNLFDHGTLSVAKFDADGTIRWLPLVHGQGVLTEKNGFHSQADICIETRRAADLVGATPMDRPEGIAVHPKNGKVYVALSKNAARKSKNTNPANPRANNRHGHIVELVPPSMEGAPGHAQDGFGWSMFLEGGNPDSFFDNAMYLGPVSNSGWLSCPDNLVCDPKGRLWIATDGQPESIEKSDSLYAADTEGPARGIPHLFFNAPKEAEVTGPAFTPDGKTLFLSVQHPGGDFAPSHFDAPSTRWPDFDSTMPPRPSVVVITKDDGGAVGG